MLLGWLAVEAWSLGPVTAAAEIQILVLEKDFPTAGIQRHGNSYTDAILDRKGEI